MYKDDVLIGGGVAHITDTAEGPKALRISGQIVNLADFETEYYNVGDRYQRVDFIESHGNEYIDTGIKPTSSLKSELVLSYSKFNAENMALGASTSSAYAAGTNYVIDASSNKFIVAFGKGGSVGTSIKPSLNTKYTITLNENSDGTLYIDGNAGVKSTNSKVLPDYNLFLFGRNISGSKDNNSSYHFNGKIYSCILTDTTLLRDFIPVKNILNDEYGMYDLVSQQFFGNKGTGAFTGPGN